MIKLTQEYLKECLHYDPNTGIFTWKVRPVSHFEDGVRHTVMDICSRWNIKHVNTIAGSKDSKGYIVITINNKPYKAHRLSWLYTYGYFPENKIDHFDRDKSNNRIINLREVGDVCSVQNTGISKNNTSGVKGVSWCKECQKWQARISIHGKRKNLGFFLKFDNAVKARFAEERDNHLWSCSHDSSAYDYLVENGLIEV